MLNLHYLGHFWNIVSYFHFKTISERTMLNNIHNLALMDFGMELR